MDKDFSFRKKNPKEISEYRKEIAYIDKDGNSKIIPNSAEKERRGSLNIKHTPSGEMVGSDNTSLPSETELEKIKESKRNWRLNHPNYLKQWRMNNPEKYAEEKRRRNAKYRQLGNNYICGFCKKKIKRYPSSIVGGIYCSHSCSALDNLGKIKNKPTIIEDILEKWLIVNGIKFRKQTPIKFEKWGTIPDFFIEPNICIYTDGKYWHNLPHIIEKDNKINAKLSNLGYKVIRLKEQNRTIDTSNLMEMIKSG